MNKKAAFNTVIDKHFKTLKQYVPIVDRVHGTHHPEFHDVRRIFERMVKKTAVEGSQTPDLKQEFDALRNVTNTYQVPSDVCESYEAVYRMLSEVDSAYQALLQ